MCVFVCYEFRLAPTPPESIAGIQKRFFSTRKINLDMNQILQVAFFFLLSMLRGPCKDPAKAWQVTPSSTSFPHLVPLHDIKVLVRCERERGYNDPTHTHPSDDRKDPRTLQ